MKKTKENVYVVIDTPKKAKKVKKLLDMFGENYTEYPPNVKNHSGIDPNWYYGFADNKWQGINTRWVGFNGNYPTEVSIKELRNIIAAEHLRDGDVVVVKNNSGKWIVKLTGNNIDMFEHSVSYNLDLGVLNDEKFTERHNKIYGASFIRYATEEEKALLEEKPKELTKEEVEKKVVEYAVSVDWNYDRIQNYIIDEIEFEEWIKLDGAYSNGKAKVIIEKFKPKLEAGKWYKFAWSDKPDEIRGIYFVEKVYGIKVFFSYGIDFIRNEWKTKDWHSALHVWEEATKEEVEQALIKEAKKRGYVEGARVKCLYFNKEYTLTSEKHWEAFDGKELLMVEKEGTGVWIFQNGKWAEIVKTSFAGENIGKRVRVIDGGSGATGCNGQTGVLVDESTLSTNGFFDSIVKVKTDYGEVWGLNSLYHEIEYLTKSSPLTVKLEIKDIATLQVIQKTLKDLEEKLTKLI